MATDGDETHPQVRNAGHSIFLHPVVELREVADDMAEILIQSGAIGIHSGIGHRELGCMAVILHQVPATLALVECPHVKIAHSAPGRGCLSGLLDGDTPGH